MSIKQTIKKILKKMKIFSFIKIEINRILAKIFNFIYSSKDEIEYKNQYVTLKLEDSDVIDIVVVAFNNFRVIEKQYNLLNVFMKDQYCYTIFDNSTKIDETNKIREFCEKNKIPYIKLKKSLTLKKMISENHAIALNYIYRYYLKMRHAKYIGFLDHDIFPIEDYNVTDILDKQNIYGYMIIRDEISYVWPGFCFFKFDYIFDKKVDFLPDWLHHGDTGASNYKTVYKEFLEKNDLIFANHERRKILDGNDPQNDMYSIIDDKWIHMLNGGNWKNTKDFMQKQEEVFNLLDEILENSKVK